MRFEDLDEKEKDVLHSLPFLVAILIASADGKIDEAEIERAILVAHAHTATIDHPEVVRFYLEINENYEDKLKMIIHASPYHPHDRLMHVTRQLEEASRVLQKLESSFVLNLFKSLQVTAQQVAKASGGIFGYGGISSEESTLINLDMLYRPEDIN
jgi:hypothetical protein